MKITLLGTAAISYPFAFCNCQNCKLARIQKGKSIRKCSSILINDDLIIDLGPDTQTALTMYNKDMGKIKYLLQTHTHHDHCYEIPIITRIPSRAIKNYHKLELYTHPKCLKKMSDKILQYKKVDLLTKEGQEKLNMHINPITEGEIKEIGNYKIKAIESLHDKENGSLLYVISSNNKNIFYATDTPSLTNKALKELSKYRLDVVIMDHTFGNVEYSYSHLNEALFIEQINKMKKLEIIDNNTQIYGTHISHDGLSYHEIIEERAIQNGYHIAYDGLEIEI